MPAVVPAWGLAYPRGARLREELVVSELEDTIDALMGALDYPMFILTAAADGQQAGCLIGFATQCSISPFRFLICLSDKNRTLRVASSSDALAVHFPAEGTHELIRLFGEQTGDDLDKFARCRWRPGPGGLPILEDCPRWFAGKVIERLKLGDHWGFVLEPFAAEDHGRDESFSFQQARRLEPGHEA